ncbi:MAG: S-layer homology domain-containing protein [Candidatus Altimarinota bacterium]
MKYLAAWFLGIIISTSFASPVSAFSDLPETHHHYFPLTYLEFEEVIQGYPDGTVRPGQLINRAELIKILVEGLGHTPNPSTHRNCFPDVKDEWFAQYICYALMQGWISGYPDGTFKPAQSVNKVEALKIILNAFGVQTVTPRNSLLFQDTSVSDWFAPYVAAAFQKNLLEEIESVNFNPTNARNRGEIAEMVARIKMIQHMNDPEYNDWIRAEFENYLLLHELRRENGIEGKFKLNPILTKVAREHSRDMAENLGELSHFGSDGRASYERMNDAGIPERLRNAENVGRGWISGRDIIDGIEQVHRNIFMPEPDEGCNHRTTLLSKCLPFTEVGIGVYVKDGYVYFTNDFSTSE